MLNKRTLTGACVTVAVYLLIAFSHIPPVSFGATVMLSLFAVFEIYRAAGFLQGRVLCWGSAAAAVLICGIPLQKYGLVMLAVLPLLVLLFGGMMLRQKSCRLDRPWKACAVAFSVVLLARAFPELRSVEHGLVYLVGAVTVCFVTDVAAYLVGSRFGRHKLLPSVSPNKSVEGAAAGIAAAVLLMVLYGWLLQQAGNVPVDGMLLAVYGVLASVVGQFGDLAMSVVKRVCGVKDFGDLLPGHGGMLDRFDSHLFCVAFTLVFCTVTGGYIR